MILLDTDICVGILKGNQKVLKRHAALSEVVYTTWITVAELYYGVAKSAKVAKNLAATEMLLAGLKIVGVDQRAAQHFGEMKALLERKGERLDDADLLIAGVTLANQATLVTGNLRHFSRIPGITVENWL